MKPTYYNKIPKKADSSDLVLGILQVALGIATSALLIPTLPITFCYVAMGALSICSGICWIMAYQERKAAFTQYRADYPERNWQNDYEEQSKSNANLDKIAEKVVDTLKEDHRFSFASSFSLFSKKMSAYDIKEMVREAIVAKNDVSKIASLDHNALIEMAQNFAAKIQEKSPGSILAEDKRFLTNAIKEIASVPEKETTLVQRRNSITEETRASSAEKIKIERAQEADSKRERL